MTRGRCYMDGDPSICDQDGIPTGRRLTGPLVTDPPVRILRRSSSDPKRGILTTKASAGCRARPRSRGSPDLTNHQQQPGGPQGPEPLPHPPCRLPRSLGRDSVVVIYRVGAGRSGSMVVSRRSGRMVGRVRSGPVSVVGLADGVADTARTSDGASVAYSAVVSL